MTASLTRDLTGLLHARSVCLIGASGDTARVAGQPLQLLLKHGFAGSIVCVNPKYDNILGQPCYPSISALPQPTDVALITLPAAQVPEAIRACGLKGIRNVVVLSAGFEETEGGRALGAAVARHARELGVTVVGPNSEGLWSPASRLLLTHGTAANRDTVLAGPVTVLSQSGSIGAAVVRSLQDAGVGCRYFISLGNETDLTLCDCVDWMVREGGSRVILLFIEGLRDGARLIRSARQAAAQGIAIAALKAGSSAAGRAATASHTGKMASSSRVYSSLFRQAGITEVKTLVELIEAGEVLSLPPAAPGGDQLGVISASGGCRALIADAAERMALRLPSFSAETQAQVECITEGQGVATNPIDLPVGTLYNPERFNALCQAVAADPHSGAILVQYANRGIRQIADHVPLLVAMRKRTGKAIAVSFLGDTPPLEVRQQLREGGVLCAREPDQAIRQLGWLHARTHATALVQRLSPGSEPEAAHTVPHSWQEQIGLLARCGIAVPQWRAVGPDADPMESTRGMAFPVAVKAFPQQADHKAEAGLVLIGVQDGAPLRDAVARIRARLGGTADVLVQEMVSGGVEVLLAAHNDPDFGPVLALGTGGSTVEWLADVAYLAMPVTPDEVERALDGLKLAQLLRPFRGRPASDRAALVAAACRLAQVFQATEGLREAEINPLFVGQIGAALCAVDVLTQ